MIDAYLLRHTDTAGRSWLVVSSDRHPTIDYSRIVRTVVVAQAEGATYDEARRKLKHTQTERAK